MQTSTAPLAIRVRHLSKKYARDGNVTEFRRALATLFKRKQTDYFWAVKDVSFELRKGEILGIIGENGSGKSTLLKILSGITKPTEGSVEIYGRVASILDIGTGFHPDLTGRENLYLRAGFLGIPNDIVKEKIEEIKAFSGIEAFMDLPIKHYSDGMFLRLAFSFLLLIDSDILLLDEVLSVGDVGFQLKCIEKIHQIASAGKTIILVSHQPQELVELCTAYLYLEGGSMVQFGDSATILQSYLHSSIQKATQQETNYIERFPNFIRWKDLETAPGNDLFRIQQVRVFSVQASETLFTDEDFWIEIVFQKCTSEGTIDVAFSMNNEISPFMVCHPFHTQNVFHDTQKGLYHSRCKISADLLNKGHYQIGIFAAFNQEKLVFSMPNILSIQVQCRVSLGAALDKLLDIPMPLLPIFQWELHEPSQTFITTQSP